MEPSHQQGRPRATTRSTIPQADVGYSHNGKSTVRQAMITSLADALQQQQHHEAPLPVRMLRGALAGLIATAPMSLSMIVMHRHLPGRQRYPLPPRQIHDKVNAKTGAGRNIEDPQASTLAAHFIYGAVAGAIYGGMVQQKPLASIFSGVVFGLAVWAGSYMGWLPALDILPPATKQPVERNTLMIVAHVVWGSITGLLVGLLTK